MSPFFILSGNNNPQCSNRISARRSRDYPMFYAFAGFLWIGRGRYAVVYLFASLLVVPLVLWDLLTAQFSNDLAGWILAYDWRAWLVSAAISLLLVLPFRASSMPSRWFSRGAAFWLVQLACLAIPLLVALTVRSFFWQPFSVPAGSMTPNLQAGDYLFVSKRAYGYGPYSVPFGPWPLWSGSRMVLPQRGDIVVFRHPNHTNIDYIKRLIGLPGDEIQMIGGILHLNGVAVPTENSGPATSGEDAGRAVLQRETLPDGTSYLIQNIVDGSLGDESRAFTVPEGHFFVMGDNRDNSADSRFDLGFIPFENLVGRAERLFWNSEGLDYRERSDLRPVKTAE